MGDVGIGPRVFVERKTVADLAVSLADGRLFRQAYDLAGRAERPLFLVEGAIDPLVMEQTGLSPNSYRGLMLSLMVGFGIPVLRTRSVEETAVWLARLADHESRRGRRSSLRRAATSRRDPEKGMLASLPGIGASRAEALLAEFGSVRGVLEADAARLRRVEGIGRALATYLASLGRVRRPSRRPDGDGSRGQAGGVAEPRPVYSAFGTCLSNSR